MFAAPPSFTGFEYADADLIGKLLNLASDKFEYVVVDMPRVWFPWCENIVRGSDDRFIVTQMTVSGLRQGRRTADMLEHSFGLDSRNSVIVNRCPWLGRGGIKKRHAARDCLASGWLASSRIVVSSCAGPRTAACLSTKSSGRIGSRRDLRVILEAS